MTHSVYAKCENGYVFAKTKSQSIVTTARTTVKKYLSPQLDTTVD